MLVPLVTTLAGTVVMALVPTTTLLGLRYLNRRWQLQFAAAEFRQIAAVAEEAVLATEQQYLDVPSGEVTNRDKLAFATSSLLETLERQGIHLDRAVAEEKIEAAVSRLRSQAQNPASAPAAEQSRDFS